MLLWFIWRVLISKKEENRKYSFIIQSRNLQNPLNFFSVTLNMPFVPVPKDLSKVKTKIALNLTKRQLICFSLAATVGVPTYIFTRGTIGSEAAVLLMIGLMLPFFFMAMYEKDGQPAEKILRNYVRVRLFFPIRRPYKTENFYTILDKEGKAIVSENKKTSAAGKTSDRRKKGSKKR